MQNLGIIVKLLPRVIASLSPLTLVVLQHTGPSPDLEETVIVRTLGERLVAELDRVLGA